MATLRILAERVQRILDAGYPSNDSRFTLRQIFEELRSGIAILVKNNWLENANAEDLHYANDLFTVTYKAITLLTDSDSGLKYFDIPANMPGLPKNRQIRVIPTKGSRAKFIPVRGEELFLIDLQPSIPNHIPYFVEDHKIKFKRSPSDTVVDVVIVGAVKGVDDDLHLPLDAENQLVQMAVNNLSKELSVSIDNVNDGKDIR